jgi:hypothetical protein
VQRLTAAEDQRYPFLGVHEAGGGDERGDQAVDCAHADRAGAARAAQDFVELGVGEHVCHAASPPPRSAPVHALLWLVLTRYTEPEPELSLLLKKLKLELPAQPPPKITASTPPPPTPL